MTLISITQHNFEDQVTIYNNWKKILTVFYYN